MVTYAPNHGFQGIYLYSIEICFKFLIMLLQNIYLVI